MIDQAFITIEKYYCPLSEETKVAWKQCAEVMEINKGEHLLVPGQLSNHLYYIIKGGLRAYYLKDGKHVTDWFAFENDFICAIPGFFTGDPCVHYITLIENAVLIKTGRNDIMKLFDKFHDFERLGRITTTKTLIESQLRLASLQFETARQKYLNLLQVYPNIEQRAALGDIASFLGITLETLSRIRAKK